MERGPDYFRPYEGKMQGGFQKEKMKESEIRERSFFEEGER